MHLKRNIYVCPKDRIALTCTAIERQGDEVVRGKLCPGTGHPFEIADGIPDLTYPTELLAEQATQQEYYEGVADIYDDVAHLTFQIQGVDESAERTKFVNLLDLQPHYRVLELACGTGRDSEIIARQLDANGAYYLQDLSRSMLVRCRDRLKPARVPTEFSVGNACYLCFPDNYFDAVFSFGGIGVFGDIRRALKEMVRVAKVGAKIVVGDESMPPWLYETEFGRILLNNNHLFQEPVPLSVIPVEAREVAVRWMINGVYYLIEFVVGEGEPQANFDLPIPGRRGGTLRTRYNGRLEGVTPEAKDLAHQACEKCCKSMHKWLDDVVRQAAKQQLGD